MYQHRIPIKNTYSPADIPFGRAIVYARALLRNQHSELGNMMKLFTRYMLVIAMVGAMLSSIVGAAGAAETDG